MSLKVNNEGIWHDETRLCCGVRCGCAGCVCRGSRYGEKPIWLTEVYACTFPNSDWEDTPRDAVDNVILTYALTQAEGIKCAMYHQLFDSRWIDRLGADPLDREYHFGLVNRDLSFKPVLMGYCTIAAVRDAYAIDPIGRKSPLKVKNGKATLRLTGSPLIVYGLDMTGGGN